MSKTFIQRCIILPVIAAVLIGALFFLYANNARHIAEGSKVMYHDNLEPPKEMVKNRDDLKDNALVGFIKNGDKELLLRYNADYANLYESASLLGVGRIVGETGTAYIKTGQQHADVFAKTFQYTGTFGDLQYHLIEEKTVKNENAVFALPVRAHSSVTVYYRVGNNGMTDEYHVLIYEEG